MSYKIYQGELVTFTIKELKNKLIKSLVEVELKSDDEGMLLIDKESKQVYGHITQFVGIDLDDFAKFFNLTTEENIV